jgi:predicted DNA-binding transcriptional regulator AlpA
VNSKHRTTETANTNSVMPVSTIAAPVILTVEQVAARLQMPKSSIYERTRYRGANGKTPPIPHRRVGKFLRFLSADVDAWFLALPQSTNTTKRRYRRKTA